MEKVDGQRLQVLMEFFLKTGKEERKQKKETITKHWEVKKVTSDFYERSLGMTQVLEYLPSKCEVPECKPQWSLLVSSCCASPCMVPLNLLMGFHGLHLFPRMVLTQHF
jgi:hypothetical protein